MTSIAGLTNSEVQERRRRGLGNAIKISTSRSYKEIVLANILGPVNVVLYVIGLGMILVRDYRSALFTVGLVAFNAGIGVMQEVRAKNQLDRIALLARAKVKVLRDGQEQAIDPAELVQGDVVAVRAGDQIPVDGVLLSESRIEVDESQLTGESDLVTKTKGEPILSGSFCVTGSGLAEATRVGEASFANKLTADARKFQTIRTPLQREVNRLLRVLVLLVAFLMLLMALDFIVFPVRFGVFLNISSVITGMVSAGLLTLIILNYSWGAIRIGQRGGLVQQINAVESLSNVTVLCTDKTGTLTANKLKYHDVYPSGIEKSELEQLLADFAASAAATNKTGQAISAGLAGVKRSVVDEVPFASVRKWSALAINDPGGNGRPPQQGIYVLGAPEMLQEHLRVPEEADDRLGTWTDQGLRVLVFACNRHEKSLHDDTGEPILPPLTLLGLVSLSDELRPHLRETLESFTAHGVRLKVISGDSPQTVAALAKQAGLPSNMQQVSGPELSLMSSAEFEAAAAQATIFGRITPQQKEALVDVLRHQGEYVAMIGDGVNDVLSVKKANMGIAMESGSSATRAVANMVLLGDSFEALPYAFTEGQRVINSIQNILKLYLVTIFSLALLVIATATLQIGFPYSASQNTLLSFFARGIPPIALALWARPGSLKVGVYQGILHFTLPAAGLVFLFGLAVYMGSFFAIEHGLSEVTVTPQMIANLKPYAGVTYDVSTPGAYRASATLLSAQTALTGFTILTGVLLMVFAMPPIRWFAGGADYSGDWRPTILAGILILVYAGIFVIDPLQSFFQLVPLPSTFYLIITGLTVLWVFVQRTVWRSAFLERYLDLEA
jgi:cation-transporting P-type ATPase E